MIVHTVASVCVFTLFHRMYVMMCA